MTTQLVLPGEHLPIPSSSSITLGPGIASSSTNGFISTKLGLLRSSAGKSSKGKEKGTNYWIESNTKRVCLSSQIKMRS
jgi:exosome complex component RRP40